MSALNTLPAHVRAQIAACRPDIRSDLREDLQCIPEAEAAGWAVAFEAGNWHNAATFSKGAVHVWYAGRDWRAATLADGRYSKPRVYGAGIAGLRAALAAEG